MTTLRFEPIATQVAKLVSIVKLLPPEQLERIERGEFETDGSDLTSPAWSAEVRQFMLHYTAVARAAHSLLGAPQFDRLGRLYDELEEEYQPGGPPMSPVYDSHSVQHVLCEVPQGLARESPYSVLARLSKGDPARARLHELATTLAGSHLDLYRVERASGHVAELVPLRQPTELLPVALTGPFLLAGDRILARVLTFGGLAFIADSPYLLQASEREWLDYLERVLYAHDRAAESDEATQRPKAAPKSQRAKLLAKQAKQKRALGQSGTKEVILRHLQQGASARFWFDYVMDGYDGERRGIVRLAGVPDRPETLPNGDVTATARDTRPGRRRTSLDEPR
jgi:hypothetical protein